MAIMIPEKPHTFEAASQEGLMFDALSLLPDDYCVFHSFRIIEVRDDVFYESETDFLIFNKNKGILCLEAKAGLVKYQNGSWYYASGIPMHNGGPFNQASSNKWKLLKYIESCKMYNIVEHCKFLHGVWFPSISQDVLRTMSLPPEADKRIILTKEALSDPEPFIDAIFSIDLPNRVQTSLSEVESRRLVREVLCPQFNVFPSASFDSDLKKIVFHRLLREQAGILNFLDEQRTAVINGAAGTGKTMIAIEKAHRHAAAGEKVLFLCYNVMLKNFLAENYARENIDFYTISGLACKLCMTSVPDYSKLKAKLEDMYLSESFPYQHVIIDEGQDFGLNDIEEADILDSIRMIISDTDSLNGTFYVFYDRLQLVQAKRIPHFINDADCRLTLYRNCRNTENIATTSLRPFSDRKPKLFDDSVKGAPAKFYFCSNETSAIKCVDTILENIRASGEKDVVILTCKTEDSSILKSRVVDGMYQKKYRFSTCRKFKGLEADAIVIVDLDGSTFSHDNIQLYYVGTSRARIQLEIVTTLSDDECKDILIDCLHVQQKIKRPKRDLSSALNGIGIMINE